MSEPIAESLAAGSPSAILPSATMLRARAASAITLTAIILSAVSLSTLVASPTPARAEVEYPWCAQYPGGENGTAGVNCGFVTLAQCRATISGIGGDCYENPAYPGAPPHRQKARRPR